MPSLPTQTPLIDDDGVQHTLFMTNYITDHRGTGTFVACLVRNDDIPSSSVTLIGAGGVTFKPSVNYTALATCWYPNSGGDNIVNIINVGSLPVYINDTSDIQQIGPMNVYNRTVQQSAWTLIPTPDTPRTNGWSGRTPNESNSIPVVVPSTEIVDPRGTPWLFVTASCECQNQVTYFVAAFDQKQVASGNNTAKGGSGASGSSHKSFTAGAIAGISVGVVLAVALVVVLCIAFIKPRVKTSGASAA
jgi:hypothetical protein